MGEKIKIRQVSSSFSPFSQSKKPPLVMWETVNLPQIPTLPMPWENFTSQLKHTHRAGYVLSKYCIHSILALTARWEDMQRLLCASFNATVSHLPNGNCVATANISCSDYEVGRRRLFPFFFFWDCIILSIDSESWTACRAQEKKRNGEGILLQQHQHCHMAK